MKSLLLPIAIVLGIFVPALILGGAALQGWSLPRWAAISLPIILIGSVRGTAVLIGWRTLRWSWPRFKRWRQARRED